ncbi:hypothetical protein [Caproiciproducens sp. CPB-2]|uniref:hypothetical protein n=1 Tax=Caproiciproducens sp. CPB-2 TaxID=3030017 RepID=UPI0023DB943E|nr:hypothetical protein [Caproiciproducens sp. CPB-2]MDF1496321.1 hypothetical protein [Caproiciproducens sp. CPB-2]
MIIWQDKLLADSVLTQRKNKEKSEDYWAVLLTKYFILLNAKAKSCNGEIDIIKIRNYFGYFEDKEYISNNKEQIKEYIKSLLIEPNEKRIKSILKSVNSHISSIIDGKTDKVFFNDKSIIVYKSEIETLDKIKNEILRKYLLIWLVWQKAYNNQFHQPHEWCIAKDEELFKLAEGKGNSQSGQRCNNFKKLTENGYISYDIRMSTEPRERFPQRLYKVNILQHTGDIAFVIKDFQHIYEHYLMLKKGKYKFCESCGALFPYKRSTRKYCDDCAR